MTQGFVKVFLLVVVFLAGIEGLEFCFKAINYSFFPGETYAAILGFLAVMYLVALSAFKILIYQPKPKEGPKQ